MHTVHVGLYVCVYYTVYTVNLYVYVCVLCEMHTVFMQYVEQRYACQTSGDVTVRTACMAPCCALRNSMRAMNAGMLCVLHCTAVARALTRM